VPLLSIVIPTLNRPDTLRHALSTLLDQSYSDCEFIVQNNGGNAKIKTLVDSLADRRIRHFATPEVVTMTENWQAALEAASGEYIFFLGDDDAIFPDACSIAAKVIGEFGCELLSWFPYAYYWPEYDHEGYKNRLIAEVDYKFSARSIGSKKQLVDVYKFDADYSTLPMIYNSFVARSVIERVTKASGQYFLGPSPDVASGIVNAAVCPSFVRLSRPLSISGLSHHSTGHFLFLKKPDEQDSDRVRRDFGVIVARPELTGLRNLQISCATDMLLVKERLFPNQTEVELDYAGLLRAAARHINERPETYDETIGTIRQLANMHGTDMTDIVIPPPSPRLAPELGTKARDAHRIAFVLDGARLGIATAADAIRVLMQFIPGESDLDTSALVMPILGTEAMSFARGEAGVGALQGGWGETEEWGTWSVQKDCILCFDLDDAPTQLVTATFSCRPFLHPLHPRLAFSCEIADGRAQLFELEWGKEHQDRFSVAIDPKAVPANGRITVKFTFPDLCSPADLGLSSDSRLLGLGLEKMWIERPTSAPNP
jgi:glycosyltransferase involved in cell wall biosynthesis